MCEKWLLSQPNASNSSESTNRISRTRILTGHETPRFSFFFIFSRLPFLSVCYLTHQLKGRVGWGEEGKIFVAKLPSCVKPQGEMRGGREGPALIFGPGFSIRYAGCIVKVQKAAPTKFRIHSELESDFLQRHSDILDETFLFL